jgi:nucleoid-associated protein YgaU
VKLLRLVCSDPKVDISVSMGDGPATPTAGHAGWEIIERVEGKSITDRSSVEPFSQDVPVFLDGYAKGNSIQRQLDELLSLGGENAAVFRAYGPIHRPGIRYVFGGEPDFGEVIRDDDGTLLRQRLTLKLTEYVRPDTLKRRKRQKRGMGGRIGQAQALSYTCKAGDTLARIAYKQFDGDWRRWREIGDKNGIRDPFKQLDPGRVIKL